ncbi:MAG: PAS domain S-box protein [Rhodospirillales bacterium]|nr:PAS domain S-box protein [Rhodospirillales bacterium]
MVFGKLFGLGAGKTGASSDKGAGAFLAAAPVGFYALDTGGRFVFANPAFAEMLGRPLAEIVGGLRLHDVLAEPIPAGTAPYDPFGGLGLSKGDVRFRHLGGVPALISIVQTCDPAAPDGVVVRAMARDAEPEREMASALARSELGFRRFFENAPVGIALVDPDGRLTETNRAFQRLAGTDREGAAGRNLTMFVVPEERAELIGKLRRLAVASTGKDANERAPEHINVRLVGSDGKERIVATFARALDESAGTDGATILHFLDISEQRRLEQQFAQSQKMQAVGQLAGGVAHDFNNLLTAMIGFCDLLLLRHQPGDASFADIMQIRQNANRAANLVRQLLAFSRQQTLQPKVLDVTDALTELSHLLRRLIGAAIELKVVHARDLWLVRVDQGQLEQVIINLAVNARDAMGNGGTLTIRTSNATKTVPERYGDEEIPPGEYVRVDVADTGTGIPPDIIGRIFEPFFSTKAIGSGTGLGLSTVYGIVRQTGGFVQVDSAPGRGSTFTLLLPRWTGPAQEENADSSPARRRDLTGAGTVLLVEDEDAVRLFGARALRNKGYKVVEAKTGDAALDIVREIGATIDLMITDVVMPQMDGTTLIRESRKLFPALKIVCISGYAEEQFRQTLAGFDNVHFLPKPFSLDQLAAKAKEAMRPPA